MMIAEVFRELLQSSLAGTLAVLMVFLLRKPLRLWLGARVAYFIWIVVPMATVATLIPAPAQSPQLLTMATATLGLPVAIASPPMAATSALDPQTAFLSIWILGCIVALVLFARRQRNFTRLVRRREDMPYDLVAGHGPAVAGLLQPRIVLPSDFLQRYSADEQALVLAHERLHLQRGDIHAQTVATALRCLFWFNPLLHVAAARFRFDQELACDADVLARFPNRRRSYADAMLKTQLADFGLPVGCHWQSSHPLKERIAMLKHPLPSTLRRKSGLLAVLLLVVSGAYGAWAAQPGAAVPANARLIDTRFAISVDGAPPTTPRVLAHDGEPFGLQVGKGNAAMQFEFTAHLLPDHQIELNGQVHRNGQLLASPSLRINNGHDNEMVQTNRDGSPLFDLHVAAEVAANAVPASDTAPAADAANPATGIAASGALAPPAYPVEALVKHLGGEVQLKLRVAADGSVKEVQVASSKPAGVFDQAAIAAASKWRLPPDKSEHWVRVPITFSPTDKPPSSARK